MARRKRQSAKERKVKAHIRNVVGGLKKRGATAREALLAKGYIDCAVFAWLNCPYCGDKLDAARFSLDHRIPLARGGGHQVSNLDLVCARCNRRKGALTGAEYSSLLAFLEGEPAMKDEVLRRLGMAGWGYRRG